MNLAIGYLVFCEGCLVFVFASRLLGSIMGAVSGRGKFDLLPVVDSTLLMALCFLVAKGLLRRVAWSWSGSMLSSLIVFGLGCYLIWSEAHYGPFPKEGYGYYFGSVLVLFSALCLAILLSPKIRRLYLIAER